MTNSSRKSTFWTGFRVGVPFVLGALPLATLFGIVATEAGFDIFQVMSMSIIVIAGASQFAALAQMEDNAPIIMVLLAALAVNMRMAMYSASIAPYLQDAPLWKRAAVAYGLVDFTYAVGLTKFEENTKWTLSQKLRFYLGASIPGFAAWYAFTFIGAWFGRSLPGGLALDFAPAIVFLSIVAPMLKTPAHVAAAFTSVIMALALSFMPFSSGLLVAAVAAMVVGAEVERRSTKASR